MTISESYIRNDGVEITSEACDDGKLKDGFGC